MHAATHQIDVAQTAARIFIQENAKNIPFDTTVITGNDFADTLEPYGLPLGFVPKTALGQDIALVIHKTPVAVSAYLELTDDKLSELTRAELARRIGFEVSLINRRKVPAYDGTLVNVRTADDTQSLNVSELMEYEATVTEEERAEEKPEEKPIDYTMFKNMISEMKGD